MTIMDHDQTLLLDRLNELEEPVSSGINNLVLPFMRNIEIKPSIKYKEIEIRLLIFLI